MSEAVILALITIIAAPLVGVLVYFVKETYSDNRDSWKQRAESAESREQELKDNLLPAVRDLVDGVKRVAASQEQDREAWSEALPAIRRVERFMRETLGEERDRV